MRKEESHITVVLGKLIRCLMQKNLHYCLPPISKSLPGVSRNFVENLILKTSQIIKLWYKYKLRIGGITVNIVQKQNSKGKNGYIWQHTCKAAYIKAVYIKLIKR